MKANNVFTSLVITLALLLFCSHVQAALPDSLNYQGHLTDDTGAPYDGTVNMSFRIYNVDAGGTELWSDTRPVSVQQGVFSIELGGVSNPFPLGLFEQPLWVGLEVETDGEMNPRRPLTSTGFSFKAGDANTLEGISAGTLDQSAHVIDTANPHGVTTDQIGAADAVVLSSHTGNTSNPHSVTAAQTGAPTSTDFTTHTSDYAAHHTRYTNNEAISAMGAKSDTNALNHDRYTDEHTVAAMLSADGAGSTLDADLVDGLQASELIDAAQDEVRVPISSLPYTIRTPGSYYLTGNLDGSGGGINIATDNVTLDLMGFTIDGGAYNDYGIDFANRSSVTIKNGIITNFGLAGIFQNYSTARYATVLDIKAIGNGTLTTAAHTGIFIAGSNNRIERCSAGDNGNDGIFSGTSSILINNTAYNNGGSYGIYGGIGSTFSGNTSYGNAGTGIYGSTNTRFSNNSAYNNAGHGIQSGTNSSLTGNTAYDNTGTGIHGSTGSTLSANAAYSNDGSYGIYGGTGSILEANSAHNNTGNYGIYGGGGASLTGNVAYSNDGIYGIYGSTGAILINNTAYANSHWGIYANGSNLIKDNTISYNNSSSTTGEGGLRVYGDSRVLGNTLNNNYRNNLYVSSGDNSIIDNQMNDSTYGINFAGSSNYWRNNVAWHNTYNYGGVIPAGGYDGGGNVSF